MRMAMVQMMLKTLNPTRQRRSMTAAANCHCSAILSWRSCSRTRSTKNCTSTRRACSWLSTAADRIIPLPVCSAADLPPPASKPHGPEAVFDGSGSGETGSSSGGLPNLEVWRWWCISISPTLPPPPTAAPPSPSPPPGPALFLPWFVVLLLWTGSNSAAVWKVWKPM